MKKEIYKIHAVRVNLSQLFVMIAILFLLSSCAPIKVNSSKLSTGKSSKVVSSNFLKFRALRSQQLKKISPKIEEPTILGFKVPAALSFSHLTRFLSSKDESLDQPTAALPSFPTVSDEPISEIVDSGELEDERALMLLSEAERYAEFSENRTLSEIARGSLARSFEIISSTTKPVSGKSGTPRYVLAILALCITILVTCGYFVISYLLEELRIKSAPRFGAR